MNDDTEYTYEHTPAEEEIARQVREQMETNNHEVATLRYELGRAIDQRDALEAELHAERNHQQRTITAKCLPVMEENARLLGLLTELAGRLHGAALPDSGLHALLDEVDCVIGAPPDSDVSAPDGLTPLHAGQTGGDPLAQAGADPPSE